MSTSNIEWTNENYEGHRRDWVVVTAYAAGGVTITFRVPDYAAKFYTIGRRIEVAWKLAKERK